jgi:hypothetical protein
VDFERPEFESFILIITIGNGIIIRPEAFYDEDVDML